MINEGSDKVIYRILDLNHQIFSKTKKYAHQLGRYYFLTIITKLISNMQIITKLHLQYQIEED